MEGRLLANRYRLERTIGHGGMAEVRRAHDETLDRPVAVKQLLSRLDQDGSFRERFRAEAHAAASLNHPNVVSVYDTGVDDDTPFIVMELVHGRSLKETIEAGGVTEDRALEIGAEVCAALQYAHDRNLIHRDIKPANILLAEDGTVKVADFGIARAIDADTVTQTAAVLGTAAYLSPEQAQGRQLDPRTDLYSLGVVLYELLCGQQPFTGDSAVTIAYQHVQELPTPLRDLDPTVSEPAEAIVMRALAKNPSNRYQSAEEMRADIARARTGRPLAAPAVLRHDDVQRTAVGAAGTAVAAGVGAAAGAAAVGGRADATTTALPPTEDAAPEGTSTRQVVGYVVLGLLTVAAVALAVLYLGGAFASDPTADQVRVPLVVEQSQAAASEILAERDLRLDLAGEENSDTVPEGFVISQQPEAGTLVDVDTAVEVVTSLGVASIEIPDLAGRTEADARTLLREVGLIPGTVSRVSDDEVEAGVVIESQPPAGTAVAPGEPVDLVVSSGEELVRVRNVVGLVDADARTALQDQDLVVEVFQVFSDGVPAGSVVSQDPEPGAEVPVGSTVVLEISRGPAAPDPEPPPPEPTVTEEPTPTATPTATQTPTPAPTEEPSP